MGVSIGHECCRAIPVATLEAEMEGDYDLAVAILAGCAGEVCRWTKSRMGNSIARCTNLLAV